MSARLETLGSLLAAMAVVAFTGELPTEFAGSAHTPDLDPCIRPRLIVPLCKRYPFICTGVRHTSYSYRYGYLLQARHRALLEEQFGLRWCNARIRAIATMNVMPSAVQIALALQMADGNHARAKNLLLSRATKGLASAVDVVTHGSGLRCVATHLWRFAGNADVIWVAMHDDIKRAAAEQGGAQ